MLLIQWYAVQFNQIRDYLSKSDADVFSKCIVPFLKADSYLQSAEISEDMFMVMLHTCLINWLDTDTATQEKILESLEHAMEKCAAYYYATEFNVKAQCLSGQVFCAEIIYTT